MFFAFMWHSFVKILVTIFSATMLSTSSTSSIVVEYHMSASVVTPRKASLSFIIAFAFARLDTRVVALLAALRALTFSFIVSNDFTAYFTYFVAVREVVVIGDTIARFVFASFVSAFGSALSIIFWHRRYLILSSFKMSWYFRRRRYSLGDCRP